MRTLLVTSGVILGMLVAAVAWFVLQPDPLGGEPTATLTIDRAAVPKSSPDVAGGNENRPEAAPPAAEPAPQAALQSAAPVAAPAERSDDAPGALPAVPDDALVENSRYGPLPRIAADGRRPSAVYARPSSIAAQPRQGEPARVAILVTGLGLSEQVTSDAIGALPGPVTLAFSPYGRNLQGWVQRAREAGHEVMLQIPQEPFDYPDNDPGPQTLLTSLPPEENQKRLQWLLARFAGYTGVTNHMGAKFAAAQDAFLPVLEELRARGLIYVDDGTAARSTAGQIARDLGLDFSVAQVQIDAAGTPEGIDQALARLESMAQENGFAVGVGTGLPVTVSRLAEWSATLRSKGLVLIPISAAVQARQPS